MSDLSRRRAAVLVTALALAGAVAGCGSSSETTTTGDGVPSATSGDADSGSGSPTECPPATGAAERKTTFGAAPPMCIDPAKKYTAVVETDRGSFTIELDPASAPKAVNNFVMLARYRYYDGIGFHRIIPGFVIQGGDPKGTGSGGPGYRFADELPSSPDVYRTGTLAMANSGPNTNGSQFFIVLEPGRLEAKYSEFGKVTDGLTTTIPAIAATGSRSGTPSAPTTMTKVTVTEG